MKFYAVLGVMLSVASVAQADIMWRLADMAIVGTRAIPPEKIVKSNASPADASTGVVAAGVMTVGGVVGYNMAMTRYQANEVLNTAAMLSIMAASANGGEGKDITLAEAKKEFGMASEICNVDMKATKEGVVTITFGEDCQVGKDTVHMRAVQEQVQKLSGERVVSSSEKECVIDMNKRVK